VRTFSGGTQCVDHCCGSFGYGLVRNMRPTVETFAVLFSAPFVGSLWGRHGHDIFIPTNALRILVPQLTTDCGQPPALVRNCNTDLQQFFGAGRRPAPWTFTRSRPTVFSDVRHSRHLRVLHWQRPPYAASPKDSWSGTRTTPLSPRTTAPQCARAPARLTLFRSTESFSLGRREREQGGGSSERERMLLLCEPRWLI